MKSVRPRHDSDCVAACLAAILEIPIEDVPDFWTNVSPRKQHVKVAAWLRRHGFHWYYADIEPRQLLAFRSEEVEPTNTWPPRGYWVGRIARVEWLRDGEANHLVVMRDHRCVFNPGGSLSEVLEPDVWLIGYFLLVPLNPALMKE